MDKATDGSTKLRGAWLGDGEGTVQPMGMEGAKIGEGCSGGEDRLWGERLPCDKGCILVSLSCSDNIVPGELLWVLRVSIGCLSTVEVMKNISSLFM